MLKIHLPELSLAGRTNQGLIRKQIAISKTVERSASIKQNKSSFCVELSDGEKDKIIIVIKGTPSHYDKSYKYIIKWEPDYDLDLESIDELDIRDGLWIKHTSINPQLEKAITPDFVNNSWDEGFNYKLSTEADPGLRSPQIGAVHAIQAHWSISNEPGIVVLPTGTGKTETMLSTLIAEKVKTLLVIVPTDALRNQIGGKFYTLGILPQFQIVNENCETPIVGTIRHAFKSIADVQEYFPKVNVAVATMSALYHCSSEVQDEIASQVSHLFIDEAHHTPATTWSVFKQKFAAKKIMQFTATPFRNDGKKLEGKIIFNYPLKKAQEEGYFKPILFKPIKEFNFQQADQVIANAAIDQLKADLKKGFDHILMARVNEIDRATEILKYYEAYPEFNPVLVHSKIKPAATLRALIGDIIQKKHRVIICVDMLGEGFDLPELKIAAFHDTKKSLAVTLQLAGRFTRVKSSLGDATFIANVASPEVTSDLEDLYFKDSDWNSLLPDLSYQLNLEQENYRTFLEGFKNFKGKFPVSAIRHPLSTIIFQTSSPTWTPLQFRKGVQAIDSYEFITPDYNPQEEVFILILGKRSMVKWAKIEDFQSINWDIIVCFFDKKTKLLFVHSSNTNSKFSKFAQVISKNPVLLDGQETFRCFHNIHRLRLFNVGVREPMGRAMNYIMRVGSDIETALKSTEIHKAIKANIFGVGYEYGEKTTIGCSHKGRIWSMRTNNIPTWIVWCKNVAKKITNSAIDPDQVLKGTLIPKSVSHIDPEVLAFAIEWPDIIYKELMRYVNIFNGKIELPIWNVDLTIVSQTSTSIHFSVDSILGKYPYTLRLSKSGDVFSFKFIAEGEDISIIDDGTPTLLSAFFEEYPPFVFFVDGGFLEGNLHTVVKTTIPPFPKNLLTDLPFTGVDLKKESQTYLKRKDSIQYYVIDTLKKTKKFIVLLDDDDKGEIGDIVGFSVDEESRSLEMDIYHCKYSGSSDAGQRVKDFHEVCGQAQRSIKWMENTEEIFVHLLRRSDARMKLHGVDRFEVGTENDLEILKRRVKKDIRIKMSVHIVQPGLSKAKYDEKGDVSILLGVVENYLKETWNATLSVITMP